MIEERRCPSCGALVALDAEWCGQCYAPLREPEAETVPQVERRPAATTETPGGGQLDVREGTPWWECPVCGERNTLEASLCATCGTPFARLFQEPQVRPAIEPQSAAVWSLVWPGLGHWRAGYRADAVARIVLFAWTFGALLVLLVARFGKGGLGSTLPLFGLFLGSATAVYIVSAVDAYRLAAGDAPLVSSRAMLWASAALVVITIVVASFVTLPAARR